jgi:DNA repair exonuclease SbcCD ATPase subunit
VTPENAGSEDDEIEIDALDLDLPAPPADPTLDEVLGEERARHAAELGEERARHAAELESLQEDYAEAVTAAAEKHAGEIDDLASRLTEAATAVAALTAQVSDHEAAAVVRTSQLEDKGKRLAAAEARIADLDRQLEGRRELCLFAVRGPSDNRDRHVLARNAAEAAGKIEGAHRVMLVSPAVIW